MTPPNTTALAWEIDERSFPHRESVAERLRYAARYAMLAPSPANTQPWSFRLAGESLELRLDPGRTLPVADPRQRLATISCGAALFQLRTALAHFGIRPNIELCPRPGEPDCLAEVSIGELQPPTPEEDSLFAAIAERRTLRGPFAPRDVTDAIQARWSRAAAAEFARFWVIGAAESAETKSLIQAAAEQRESDVEFRREQLRWMRASWSRSEDGVPMRVLGYTDLACLFGPRLARLFDRRPLALERTRAQLESAPVTALLATDRDDPEAWLRAGTALARILLLANRDGVHASYHNEVLEIPELRRQLEARLSAGATPQLLLGMGYAEGSPAPLPRRSVLPEA